MAAQAIAAVAVVAVPMVLDALAQLLNIPKNKMQEYYDTSQALRDYIASITSNLNIDIQNELLQVTPSTTPRFDIPWITEELKKKQDDLFKLKKEITDLQIKAKESNDEKYLDSPEGRAATQYAFGKTGGPSIRALNVIGNSIKFAQTKQAFRERKKREQDNFTKQTAQKYNDMKQVVNRPIKNNNPTYQSIQERIQNAQIQKEK